MVDGCAVSRMVHYTNSEGECSAAVITKVWNKENGCVNLTLFPAQISFAPNPVETKSSVDFSQIAKRGTWHWPERA